ncbi:MAG TPA: hypothetical protein VIL54_01580 [Natronosporangium sp.]
MTARSRIRDLLEDVRYLWEDRAARVAEVVEQEGPITEAERLRLQRDLLVLDSAFAEKLRAIAALLEAEGTDAEG